MICLALRRGKYTLVQVLESQKERLLFSSWHYPTSEVKSRRSELRLSPERGLAGGGWPGGLVWGAGRALRGRGRGRCEYGGGFPFSLIS